MTYFIFTDSVARNRSILETYSRMSDKGREYEKHVKYKSKMVSGKNQQQKQTLVSIICRWGFWNLRMGIRFGFCLGGGKICRNILSI